MNTNKKSMPRKRNQKKEVMGKLIIKEFYDALMEEIEPDLTTDFLPDLEGMYEDETKEERRNRLIWYARAFDIFEQRLDFMWDLWKEEIADLQENIMALAKKEVGKKEKLALEKIERSLDTE